MNRTRIKKAYDVYDFPWEEQVKMPQPPRVPPPKVRKKPGPKPKPKNEFPVFTPPPPPIPGEQPQLIRKLVNEIRKLFVRVKFGEPILMSAPDVRPDTYVSNITLGTKRIGVLKQTVGGDRVILLFDKSENIPMYSDGYDIVKFADKIKEEVEKNYTKKLAAKLGYRTAIRVAAHRRRLE